MRWTILTLAVGLAACGQNATDDSQLELVDSETADARSGSAAPLVISLLDTTTGAVVDGDLADGSLVTIDPSHDFTISGSVRSGRRVNGNVKLRLTDPDG